MVRVFVRASVGSAPALARCRPAMIHHELIRAAVLMNSVAHPCTRMLQGDESQKMHTSCYKGTLLRRQFSGCIQLNGML